MRAPTMRTKRIIASLAACAALAAGCGGDTYVQQASTPISKGQELTDLQRALQEGALTQREYDDLRARIMRRQN
jgi:hypothetical protein